METRCWRPGIRPAANSVAWQSIWRASSASASTVPVELVAFDSAGKMFDAVKAGAWDVAFLAVDPGRADQIDFTAPYIEIEGTYLVPAGSPVRAIENVDRKGVRMGISWAALTICF